VARRAHPRAGVSHAQFFFTILRLLRPIFKYHRRDLGQVCKSVWQALREMFREVASDPSALAGVVTSVQSCGDRPISIPMSTLSPAE
jgi:hypothetical protein